MDRQGAFLEHHDFGEAAGGGLADPHRPIRGRGRRSRPRRDSAAKPAAASRADAVSRDDPGMRFDAGVAAVTIAAALAQPQMMTGPMVFLDEEPADAPRPLPGL
jgi:hypothetical protein